jgi:hypothetical protein
MQQKSMLEILNETVQYYSEDVTRRGVMKSPDEEYTLCVYLTDTGCMCAVGRCMVAPTRNMIGGVATLHSGIKFTNLEEELKPEYRGHSIEFWQSLQGLHDDSGNWGPKGLTLTGKLVADGIKIYYDLQ